MCVTAWGLESVREVIAVYLSAAEVLQGLCAAWFFLAEGLYKNKQTFIIHFILGLSEDHSV